MTAPTSHDSTTLCLPIAPPRKRLRGALRRLYGQDRGRGEGQCFAMGGQGRTGAGDTCRKTSIDSIKSSVIHQNLVKLTNFSPIPGGNMGKPGVKPTPTALRGLKSGRKGDNTELPGERKEFTLEPPSGLTEREQWIWDNQIRPAYWLEQADMLTILAFVYLSAELIDQKFNVPTRRIEEWRRMGNELVLTTAEQVRVGLRNLGPDSGDSGPDDGGKKDFFG